MGNPLANHELYCRNMAAVFRVDPKLAQGIDECGDDASVAVEASRRGPATCAVHAAGAPAPAEAATPQTTAPVRTPPNGRIYLHSRVDPLDEARRWAEAIELGNDFCFIVSGFGLGHHLKALHARLRGDAFLVVSEPDLRLLRAAMESVDLADLFANDRCVILTSIDKNELQSRLEPRNALIMMGAQFVAHAPSERVAGEFHARFRKMTADYLTYVRMSLVTLVANSRVSCKNVAYNLPTAMSTPPIDVLRDRFKGYPAIIVSAGPSLRRNIDQLPALKNRAVLIAVQTTFKTLIDRGVVPDFVTSLDYHALSRRFFENVGDHGGTHLVAEPKATWEVVDAYRGPVSLLDNHFARLCLGDALAARGGLKAGATVAHLAFYLALYMGCDPIVTIGQDLGYTDHVYYVPGTSMHEMWRPEINRFNTMETREWERIVRNRKILMKVKDVHGHEIYTDEQLFTYLQQFEADFAAIPGRVIDATEGGVRKAYTTVMPLAEVGRRYCREAIPPDKFRYREELDWRDTSRLPAARKEVESRLKEADDMRSLCEQVLGLLREMQNLVDRPTQFNQKLAEVDVLRMRVRQAERTYQMVSMLSQHAELQRFSADRHIALSDLSSAERARRQIERDIRFVEGIREGSEALHEILAGCLERFDVCASGGAA